jgi:alkyl hydroperoxide reductase subunit AhpF
MFENCLKEIVTRFNDFALLPKTVLNGGGSGILETLVLADIAKHEKLQETDDPMQDKLVLTLISLEEENTLKNNYPVRQEQSVAMFQKPALHLNLYLLFAANFKLYGEALKHLSLVIQFFQANQHISYTDEFSNTHKLTFTIHNIGFENLHNLWTVLGGHSMPSVLYKARLLYVQQSPLTGADVITQIDNVENLN